MLLRNQHYPFKRDATLRPGTPLRNQSCASPRLLPPALVALAIISLGGCLQTAFEPPPSKDPPNAYDAVRSADLQPRFPEATRNANTGGAEPKGVSYYGAPVEALVATAPIPLSTTARGASP